MDTEKLVKDIAEAPASSRRGFLKIAAAAGAGVALAGGGISLQARAATDAPPTIIAAALTAEYLAVTFITNTLANATAIGLRSDEITTIQAILAEEAIHVRYLQAYGASALASTFAFPAGTFTSRTGFATTAVLLETAFVAAYMAATREFAQSGRADLAQLTYQIGAVEAEHRALARVVGGFLPYSDVAFESNLVSNVGFAPKGSGFTGAADFLTNNGFLTPSTGNSYAYSDTLTATAITSYSSLLLQTTP